MATIKNLEKKKIQQNNHNKNPKLKKKKSKQNPKMTFLEEPENWSTSHKICQGTKTKVQVNNAVREYTVCVGNVFF